MPVGNKAKGIRRPRVPAGHAAGHESTALSLHAELRATMERVLRAHKAEVVAAEVDRKRSTVYAWAGHPESIPAGAILTLADLDPDPEALSRIAGCLLAHVAARALARQAMGRALLIVEEIGPGRWGRR